MKTFKHVTMCVIYENIGEVKVEICWLLCTLLPNFLMPSSRRRLDLACFSYSLVQYVVQQFPNKMLVSGDCCKNTIVDWINDILGYFFAEK